MNYWIFMVTYKKDDEVTIKAEDILAQRLEDRFWGLGENTPNRKNLKSGDRVVFYVGMPKKHFAATATLASDSFALSSEQTEGWGHGKAYLHAHFGVRIDKIQILEEPRLVTDLIPDLSFIENPTNWGAYFQGGVRQLSEADFDIILEPNTRLKGPREQTADEIINESQFALEAHLEEFMDRNWDNIHFGANLIRYSVDDQSGRQFPAGTWSIDFLCVDKVTNDYVVIELKRGKSSDAVVGQVLRYMGWVDRNLPQRGKNTRGIIICQEIDDALRYAVSGLSNVSALTYKIDFQLHPLAPWIDAANQA